MSSKTVRRAATGLRRRLFAIGMGLAVAAWATGGWAALTMLHRNAPAGDAGLAAPTDPPRLGTPDYPLPPPGIDRSTAVVSASVNGIDIVCGTLRPDAPSAPAGGLGATCHARSVGSFEGTVLLGCIAPAWLSCRFDDDRVDVSPEHGAAMLLSVPIAAGAPPGRYVLRVVASSGGISDEARLPVTIGMPAPDLFALACDDTPDGVPAGGVVTLGCTFDPGSYRGPLHPACPVGLTLYTCTVTPPELDIASGDRVHIGAAWTFDVLTPPGVYGPLVLDLAPDVAAGHSFSVEVPAVAGTFTVACEPDVVAVASTGAAALACTAASVDGFDGYVRLSASADLGSGTIAALPRVVRVRPDVPADATLELQTTGVQPRSYPDGVYVLGEAQGLQVRSAPIRVDVG